MDRTRRSVLAAASTLIGGTALATRPAQAASAREISRDASHALQVLYASQPKARELSKRASAILVFTKIIKAGLVVGGQSGDGELMVGG